MSGHISLAASEQDYQYYAFDGEFKLVEAIQPPLGSVWLDETSPKKLGTLLFVPAPETGPTSPIEVDYLRRHMPKWGWQTIAILPRTIPIVLNPLAEVTSAASATMAPNQENPDANDDATAVENESELITEEEPSNAEQAEDAPDNVEQPEKPIIVNWIQSSFDMREPAFGFEVVVVQAEYAALVAQAISNQELEIDALVMINAHIRNIERQKELAVLVAQLEIPVLDLISEPSLEWLKSQPAQRLQQAKKQQKLDYRQATFSGASSGEMEQQRLSKSIYGWMHSLGWY
ncbi:DUF3530 family protein [Alginatibacterium sediminis]|uniref:DUF3530 family protein n=1 Tax=Alginatibacterium sediminis TaxID=2164068 RepID=A0A420E7P4_9ALTE|nr:DUF3530 family protein [Alginatibacterium sediminis]RKF14546.1 DUF3530 family protein [Alginatibacterium sediminis]